MIPAYFLCPERVKVPFVGFFSQELRIHFSAIPVLTIQASFNLRKEPAACWQDAASQGHWWVGLENSGDHVLLELTS